MNQVSVSPLAGKFANEWRLDTGWGGTPLPRIANVYPERRPVGEGTFFERRKSSHARIYHLIMLHTSQYAASVVESSEGDLHSGAES